MAENFRYGDKVYVKIYGNSIILATASEFDLEISLDYLGYNPVSKRHFVHLPRFLNIKYARTIVELDLDDFDLDSAYLDEQGIELSSLQIVGKEISQGKSEGMTCTRCEDFSQYAEMNQTDGSFICYSCRSNPWR